MIVKTESASDVFPFSDAQTDAFMESANRFFVSQGGKGKNLGSIVINREQESDSDLDQGQGQGGDGDDDEDGSGISEYEELPEFDFAQSRRRATSKKRKFMEHKNHDRVVGVDINLDPGAELTEPEELAKSTQFASKSSNKWSVNDDYIIAVLKEAYNKSWRQISDMIDSRHSWQGIQMHYLRTLRKRNWQLSNREAQQLQQAVEKDWQTRFQRLSHEMGNEFTPRRVVRHMFRVVGMESWLGPTTEEKLYYHVNGAGDVDVNNISDVPVVKDPGYLSNESIAYLRNHQLGGKDLLALYLAPPMY